MQKTNFQSVQIMLCDPTPQGMQKREDLLDACSVGEIFFGAGVVASVITGVFGLVICPWYPIIGGFLVMGGGSTGVASRDARVVVKNGEDILNSLVVRTGCIATSQLFVDRLFKDTYVIGPLFGSVTVRALSKPAY